MTALEAVRAHLPTLGADTFLGVGWTVGFFVCWDTWWNGTMNGFGRELSFEVTFGLRGVNLWLRFPVPRGGWDGVA